MEQVNIIMDDDGKFNLSGANAGYIEEYCAKILRIQLNNFFKGSILSYYTISFDVCGLGKKIMTENIYKVSGVIEGQAYYNDGYLYCPLFDYITAAPYVNIQLDGYETNTQGDIISIYKSGIFTLKFSPSITGDSYYPSLIRTDVKLTERINEAIDNKFEIYKVSENELADYSVSTDKLKDNAVTMVKLSDKSVDSRVLAESAVTALKLSDNCVKNRHISDAEISLNKLSQNAINDFLEIIKSDDTIVSRTDWQPIYSSVKDVVRTLFEDLSSESISIIEEFFVECDGNVSSGDAYAYCYYAWYIFSAISGLIYENYVNEQISNNYVTRVDFTTLENKVTQFDSKYVSNSNFDSSISNINSSIANIYNEISQIKLQMATKDDLDAIITEINTAIGEVAGGNS